MGLKDWNADNKQSEMNQKHLHTTTRAHVLTFDGLSWLMMVVLPLLSSPRHKTLTSFFLRPSQDESLSSSPIGQRGPDPPPPPCKTNASAHRRAHELLLNIARCARSSRMRPGRTQPWTQPYTRRSCEPSPRSGSPGCAAPALRQVISLGWFNLWKHLVTRS